MNQKNQIFDEWCTIFPTLIEPDDKHLLQRLDYFEKVLTYYCANLVLCDPYQIHTKKFVMTTIPNTVKQLLILQTTDPNIIEKITTLLAKIIAVSARITMKNTIFLDLFTFIPDLIYHTNCVFLKQNTDCLNQIQLFAKAFTYQELLKWGLTMPRFDWDIFHFLIQYLKFIQNLISIEEALQNFLISIEWLIHSTITSPQLFNHTYTLNDLLAYYELGLTTSFSDTIFNQLSKFLVAIFVKIDNIELQKQILQVLVTFQSSYDKNFYIAIALNEYEFDKFISNPNTSMEIMQYINPLYMIIDERRLVRIISDHFDDQKENDRFWQLFLFVKNSFVFLREKQPKVLEILLKLHHKTVIYLFILSTLFTSTDQAYLSNDLIDMVLMRLYQHQFGFQLITSEPIDNQNIIERLLIFILNHSKDQMAYTIFRDLTKSNRSSISLLTSTVCKPLLHKDDFYSYCLYYSCLLLNNFSLDCDDFKIIWAKSIKSEQLLILFENFLSKRSLSLFQNGAFELFVKGLLLTLDFSSVSPTIIDLLADLIYIQNNPISNKIDISGPLKKFDQLGMKQLFQAYFLLKNENVKNYAKSRLLRIWTNCEPGKFDSQNNSLAQYLRENAQTVDQFKRSYEFLNDYLADNVYGYVLDDFNKKPLKETSNTNMKLNLILQTDQSIFKGSMHFSSSDTISQMLKRVEIKFNCKQVSLPKNIQKQIYLTDTLEMIGFVNNQTITMDCSLYETDQHESNFVLYMPEYSIGNTPLYQFSFDLLHTKDIPSELALSILNFLYCLPLSSELCSLFNSSENIIRILNDCLNIYEIEFYLQVMFSLLIEKVGMFIETKIYLLLIQKLSEIELHESQNLLISILIKIIPSNEPVDVLVSLINRIIDIMISDVSFELFTNCCDLLISLNSECYRLILNQEIFKRIMQIANQINYKGFGKVIKQITMNNQIFNLLYSNISAFLSKPDRHSVFFELIVNSVDDNSKELQTFSNFIINHLYDYGSTTFEIFCDFLITQPELFGQIDIQFFFDFLEQSNTSPKVLTLIKHIYLNKKDTNELINRLISNFSSIDLDYNITDSYQIIKKNEYGSGLRNLGATCYINSALQLLFNTSLNSFLSSNSLNDNWAIELQILFALMKFGKASTYDPINFIKSYKMMGNEIKLTEQQDSLEFLSSIIDQLPDELVSPFKGVLINHFDGIDSPYKSSNEEIFTNLSLTVDNDSNSLESSLESFIHSVILNNYNTGDKVIRVEKKTAIQKPPQILLIQLCRFQYDSQSNSYQKINSSFSFPLSFDISKYCEIETNSNYHLSGLILHSGSLNTGHFFYVGYDRFLGQWIDYNDSIVDLFNISNLANFAFGSNENQFGLNAYILVYENDTFRESQNYKTMILEDQLSKRLKYELTKEIAQIHKVQCRLSKEFFDLILATDNLQIMYNYFTKTVLHSNDYKSALEISSKIIEKVKENLNEFKQLIDLIEKDQTILRLIMNIKDVQIGQILVDFLKDIIKKSKNGESIPFSSQLFASFELFKKKYQPAKWIAEIILENLIMSTTLIDGQEQFYALIVLKVFQSLFMELTTFQDFANADLDVFIHIMKYFIPAFQSINGCIELIESLRPFISKMRPSTLKLFEEFTEQLYSTL